MDFNIETSIILGMLFIFIFKTFDCSLNVLKNVFLLKEKYFVSALCAAASVLFFIYTAQQKTTEAYIAIFFATFFGNWLPPLMFEKLESDSLHVYEITSSTLDDGKLYADKLRELNIPVITLAGLDSNLDRILLITAYSRDKTMSRIIETNLPNGFHFNVKKVLKMD